MKSGLQIANKNFEKQQWESTQFYSAVGIYTCAVIETTVQRIYEWYCKSLHDFSQHDYWVASAKWEWNVTKKNIAGTDPDAGVVPFHKIVHFVSVCGQAGVQGVTNDRMKD